TACINIGDATRKFGRIFQLFPNHVKIADYFLRNKFIALPCILWRKPTNSPTKFLGSGMLPPHAYVTLEHEYILILRKGMKKRKFESKSKRRYKSAYFWEERNVWFSDVWTDIRGISQTLDNEHNERSQIRERSAAYPLLLPYRLINMFSVFGDNILDPYWGTGTTTLAAIVSARNSVGYEINAELKSEFDKRFKNIKQITNAILSSRLKNHKEFIQSYIERGKGPKYRATNYDFPVITKQEKNIQFYNVKTTKRSKTNYIIEHEKLDTNFDV
ncbi:MAG: site-specific DNA-methyltransferase, partial [Candidatus Lokiarchaeota archaeon]|nr:site-specific DNA-methyltransferase [Candidatus Lokiarchaeota archaeon]